MCANEYKTTDGVPVPVCEFTVCVCVCVCVLKWVRGCTSTGLAIRAMYRLSLTLFNFCNTKRNKIVGVNRSAAYNVFS